MGKKDVVKPVRPNQMKFTATEGAGEAKKAKPGQIIHTARPVRPAAKDKK